jgi:hypothetical protein
VGTISVAVGDSTVLVGAAVSILTGVEVGCAPQAARRKERETMSVFFILHFYALAGALPLRGTRALARAKGDV